MAINITSSVISGVNIQSGLGVPTHISPKGSIFVDLSDPKTYLSNGDGTWTVI